MFLSHFCVHSTLLTDIGILWVVVATIIVDLTVTN